MMSAKSPLVQQLVTGMTLFLVLGALALIWPVIIALFLGVLVLLQSFSTEQEMAGVSWTEIRHISILVDSLR